MPQTKRLNPDARDIPFKFRVTKQERALISANAHAAGVCDSDYARSITLGYSLSAAPRALTMDRIVLARSLGTLNETGGLLRQILDILDVGDLPLAVSVRTALSKVETAAEAVMKALETK